MYVDITVRSKRQVKRQPNSTIRSKPLEHIFHNPILKLMKRNLASPLKPIEARNLSVKVLDLKLPFIASGPKIINNYISTHIKPHLVHKTNTRSRSIMSELYIAANSLLN